MSVHDSPASDPVAAQAEAVLREAQALDAALNRARTTRIVLALLIVAFLGGVALASYRLYAKRRDTYVNDVMALVSQRLDKNSEAVNVLTREAQVLLSNVQPRVAKSFSDQMSKDSPAVLQRMQEESDLFATHLQDQLLAKLDEFHDKAIEKNKELVTSQFPIAKKPEVQERLVANMHLAIENLAKKYYIEEMRKSMDDLYQAWRAIPPAPEPGKDMPSTEDQLFGTLMELLKIRLTQPPRSS